MSVLEVNQVTKVYKGKHGSRITAVDDISFSVDEGEIVGFIGPNGAGKSTMLKIITGLANATKGKVSVKGFDVGKQRAKALANIGTIVENPDMYPDWSGEQNLRYFMSLSYAPEKTKEEREDRIATLLKMVGLYERRTDRVKTYSLGMKQRLGIAQALLARPSLLVLDEPTNGLDPAGIKEIRDILKHLASTYKMAILVSSHLLAEMQLVCSRFIIIDKGKIVSEVSETDIVAEPTNRYVLLTDDVVRAKDILLEKFSIQAAQTGEGRIEFQTDVSSGDVAKELILGGVAVMGLSQKSQSLEDMFMKATKEEK